jgi:hypothetical protein
MMYVSANEKAVSLNVHRYIVGSSPGAGGGGGGAATTPIAKMRKSACRAAGAGLRLVGGCTSSRIQLTHILQAPRLVSQPLSLSIEKPGSKACFRNPKT